MWENAAGHYYIHGVKEALDAIERDDDLDFPSELDSSYFVYQGENDISGQIELNGVGLYRSPVTECPGAADATVNCDKDFSVKNTFEDIDGLEVIAAQEGLFAIIQEDSGNDLGERMFISSVLEHEADGNELTYYFMAMSGGKFNTRMSEMIGIPAMSSSASGSHEFSGVIDLSGMLARKEEVRKDGIFNIRGREVQGGEFAIRAHDGEAKRQTELKVPINEKLIVLGLQAHNFFDGVIKAFQADRGGQVMLYQPDI